MYHTHLIAFGKQQPGCGDRRVLKEHHRTQHFLLPRQFKPLPCLLHLALQERQPSTEGIDRHELAYIVLLLHQFEQGASGLLRLGARPLSLIGQS